MTERIVVSCRMAYERVSPPAGPGYLARARALTQRAEALGASLVAWSAVTLAFAWDTDSIEEAIAFVTELQGEAAADAAGPSWACGIAQGEMVLLDEKGGPRADLAWGLPLVTAVALGRVAEPGEALVDGALGALAQGKLLTTGSRVSTDAGKRVRGARLDVRQPWREEAAKSVSRVVRPPLLGRPDPRVFLQKPGVVNLLRADPGYGGSRMLAEIAAKIAPAPCLIVMPSGASVEPLGALRRALVRAIATMDRPIAKELAPQLEMFLGGVGASIDVVASLIGEVLAPAGGAACAVLVDDAGEVDAESLEACARLLSNAKGPIHFTVRVDATDALPSALFDLPHGVEIDLEPLGLAEAEGLARACTAGAMTPNAAKRWARRGSYAPLGIVEAIQCGLTTGELAWIGEQAFARKRVGGMGKGHSASYWIGKRAKKTAPNERGVLAAVALFGGEVSLENAERALHAVDAPIQVREEAAKLVRAKWLVPTEPGWVALPTRTHRDTIAELLDEEPRRALHRAIADVLEQTEGELGCAEAAHHAAKAGEGERGARLALRAARAAGAAGMTKSANRLLTLARLADPKCEPQTRRQLISSLPPPLPPAAKGAPPPAPVHVTLPPSARVPALASGANAGSARAPEAATASDAESVGEAATADRAAKTEPSAAQRIVVPSAAEATLSEADRASDYPTIVDRPSPRRTVAVEPAPAPALPVSPVSPPPAPPLTPMPIAVSSMSASSPRVSPPPRIVRAPGGEAPRDGTLIGVAPAPGSKSSARGMPATVVVASKVKATLPSMTAVRPPPAPAARPPVPSSPSMKPPPLPARAQKDPSERTLLGVAPAPPIAGQAAAAPAASAAVSPAAMPASTGAVAKPPPPPRPPTKGPMPPEPSTGVDRTIVSPPPAAALAVRTPLPQAIPHVEDEAVAGRLTELAKAALLGGDAGALERWSEGLRATGEHDRFAERMEAMARLWRGQVGDALRVLKKARDLADNGHRSQASLALGVALAAAGRPEEALLEGLDALARAREKKDEKGASACLAFLSKLFQNQQREVDAELLRSASRGY